MFINILLRILKILNIDTYKLRHFAIHYKMDSVLSIIRPATYVKKKNISEVMRYLSFTSF